MAAVGTGAACPSGHSRAQRRGTGFGDPGGDTPRKRPFGGLALVKLAPRGATSGTVQTRTRHTRPAPRTVTRMNHP
jgi:hypothetical protein